MSERLLLDTNIVIALANETTGDLSARIRSAVDDSDNLMMVSVSSLWEIVIKFRLGKLMLNIPPEQIPTMLADSAIALMPVDIAHALALAEPFPDTRDPFDRLLLGICQIEGLKLVTTDGKLAGHRLAY